MTQPSYADDRAEIENLMARYLFALDWNDFDTFGQTLTEDAEFEYARGTAYGRANIVETIKGFKERIGTIYTDEDGNPAVLRHVLAQTVIRVEGDKAWTTAFWWEMANNAPGKKPLVGTFGIYEDELVRLDGQWFPSGACSTNFCRAANPVRKIRYGQWMPRLQLRWRVEREMLHTQTAANAIRMGDKFCIGLMAGGCASAAKAFV
jgi:hypothetical protein